MGEGGGETPELPSIGGAAPDPDAISALRRFAMDRVLDYSARHGAAAGFVALVAREGRVAYGRTTGFADLEARIPMTLETRFQIASMTKPIAAVAAMILVEEGRLALEDRIDTYLPAFAELRVVTGRGADGSFSTEPLAEPIRVRHLLTFTSGLGGYGASEDPLDQAWRARDIEAEELGTLAQRIDRIAGLPLYEQPGERWRYGWSFDVLARVVEIAAGEPYDGFLERRIFAPLGMRSTSFPDAVPAEAPLARMYTHDADGELLREPRFDVYYGRGWTPGGGGLVSTAADYLRFATMLANGGSLDGVRILAPETVAQMTRLHVPNGVLADMQLEGLGWGLGVCVVADAEATPMRDTNGDFWWSGRFGTHFWISPAKKTIVVVMQQTERSASSDRPITASLVQALALP
ncbi:beta-lactamase family protein [Myxococcota bacterium]|nr:beta-lactamase family protein [Myxococcota bacterium]